MIAASAIGSNIGTSPPEVECREDPCAGSRLRSARKLHVASAALAAALCVGAPALAAAAAPAVDLGTREGLWQMTRDGRIKPFGKEHWLEGRFSPDGRRVAVLAETAARQDDLRSRVVVTSPSGRVLHRLHVTLDELFEVRWSRDSSRIGYATAGDDLNDATVTTERASGGDRHVLARHVRDYSWGPGERVALVEVAGGERRLVVTRADGTHRRTLAQDASGSPRWSPDGRLIAFTRRAPGAGHAEVWKVPVGGGAPRRLSGTVGRLGGFSRDGKWILLTRPEPHGKESIWIVRTTFGDARRLLGPWAYASFGWVPHARDAWALTGGHLRRLPRDGHARDLGPLAYGPIAWSPRGDLVAWVEEAERMGFVRADGTHRRTVARFPWDFTNIYDLDWAPDGGEVLFFAHVSD